MCRSILITPVKSLPSSKQSADGGRGAGRRIWAYPVFPLQVPGGGVPGHRLPRSANRPHSRGSPVTIWGPGSCTFTLPRKGVPRKSVLHVQSHTHYSPSGAPSPRSNRQTGAGGRIAGSDPTPFFHCRFPAGGFPAPGPCVLRSTAIQKDLDCISRKHFCGRDPSVEVFFLARPP